MLAVPPDPGTDNTMSRFLTGGALLLMSAGGLILKKLNKTPRPKDLTAGDYLRLRKDLEGMLDERLKTQLDLKFRENLAPLIQQMDDLSVALSSGVSRSRRDMNQLRGEFEQLNERVGTIGGVLDGFSERFASTMRHIIKSGE